MAEFDNTNFYQRACYIFVEFVPKQNMLCYAEYHFKIKHSLVFCVLMLKDSLPEFNAKYLWLPSWNVNVLSIITEAVMCLQCQCESKSHSKSSDPYLFL